MVDVTQAADMPRSWFLAGAVRAVDKLGYGRVKVKDTCSRARLSGPTFYERFANVGECLLAVLHDVAEQIGVELQAAGLDGMPRPRIACSRSLRLSECREPG